jgi:hypothetical protein
LDDVRFAAGAPFNLVDGLAGSLRYFSLRSWRLSISVQDTDARTDS